MKNYPAQLSFKIPSFVASEKRVDFCIDIINKYRQELPLLRRRNSILENKVMGSQNEIKYWREKYQKTEEELEEIKRENGKLKKEKEKLEEEIEKFKKQITGILSLFLIMVILKRPTIKIKRIKADRQDIRIPTERKTKITAPERLFSELPPTGVGGFSQVKF